ncbi:MAG: TonB-dependent receptor [Saprospiraceae bacterium]|nr:TonB-dependent receptor [Saprospiraceae bacterium]MBK8851596.1 TonB-dependent receptor [Saprospiraceae bacterium]
MLYFTAKPRLKISLIVVIQLIIIFSPLHAQYIKGKISDKDGLPLAGAHIKVLASSLGTTSDWEGRFQLQLDGVVSDSLEISALSFQSLRMAIEKDKEINVVLSDQIIQCQEVLILGKSDRLFGKIPGSASFIPTKEMQRINALSGNEVLRRSPGVHVSDEEGLGLRANIGIRGLDPDRSRTLLVMEDGVPVALAPYGEPEMYYTPPIDRMSGIELLKGSGQILYGPQTIGGVLNYLTKALPEQREASIKVQGGSGGYYNVSGQYGNRFGNTGLYVSVLKKGADQLGTNHFGVSDVLAKLEMRLSEKSTLLLKTGFYHENSNATYIGLTQTMYDAGGQDFVQMAPNDRLQIRRYNASVHHQYRISGLLTLKSTAFAYTTSRNWRRQDFVSNPSDNAKPTNWTGVTWGDKSVPGGAIYMRNSTGNRNRQFEVAGVQTGLDGNYKWMGLNHEWKAGVRYLYEKADEQRINGTKYDAESGALTEDEDRLGNALSAYLSQSTRIHPNFTFHAGLRFENFEYERQIFRRTFRVGSQNVIRDTFVANGRTVQSWIPGAGFTWKLKPEFTLFGGVHKGFAPPRTKDGISDTGIVYELEAEQSVNSELGFRTRLAKGLQWELTAYHMAFSNQVIPVSESSGGSGSGLVNGGETLHQGIETAVVMDISRWLSWQKISLVADVNANWVDARFKGERNKDGVSITDNRTPYAPEWLVNGAVTLEWHKGTGLRLLVNYTGEQYADELNTKAASSDGRNGQIPAFYTLDANAFYTIEKINTTIQVSVKNLTDERYITSRRPQGIRVGLPRWLGLTIEHRF